ncbi:hypothetical protein AJ87_15055 [Rhizobium yanglingense]|nr:hypothetical protein AJ87_15055 [Rhizobium yanglingense]
MPKISLAKPASENFCKKMPEPKNMPEFVCKSLDLFVAHLLEHLREKRQLRVGRHREGGSCQSTSKTVAIVFGFTAISKSHGSDVSENLTERHSPI